MSSSANKRMARQLLAATLSAAALSASLGSCSDIYYDRRDTISLGADDAIASNRVTHMVDPWPRYSSDNNIRHDGERMQGAVERYRAHRVIQPRAESTSNLSQQQLNTTTEAIPGGGPAASGAPAAPVKGTP
jgi:hypothetical protein